MKRTRIRRLVVLLAALSLILLVTGSTLAAPSLPEPPVAEPFLSAGSGDLSEPAVPSLTLGAQATDAGTLLLNQPKVDINARTSDSATPFTVAEDFVFNTTNEIAQIVLWNIYFDFLGGWAAPADNFTVNFRADAAGVPGAVVASQTSVPSTRELTGDNFAFIPEVWKQTLTLATPVTLGPGTYWVEIFDTNPGPVHFLWITGVLDPVNGRDGAWQGGAAVSDNQSIQMYSPVSVPGTRFRGSVYDGPRGDTTDPIAGVKADLYVRNTGEAEPGTLYASDQTDAEGFFNFFIDESATFDYATLMVETPDDMELLEVWHDDATSVDGTALQWDMPSKKVHETSFHFEVPTAMGIAELPVVADTYLDVVNRDTNHVWNQFLVLNTLGDKALFKFNRDALPLGAEILSAYLHVNVAEISGAAGKELTAMNVVPHTPAWVTYNTAPAMSNASPPAGVATRGAVMIDVKDLLANIQANPVSNHYLYLALGVSGTAGRVSLDADTTIVGKPARLMVTYSGAAPTAAAASAGETATPVGTEKATEMERDQQAKAAQLAQEAAAPPPVQAPTAAPPDLSAAAVGNIEVVVAVDQTWIGDLVFKLVSPNNTVVTMLSRPGYAEPGDDGTGCCGDSSNLSPAHPIKFTAVSGNNPENMGSTIPGNLVVCRDDGICDYNADFSAMNGEAEGGMWQFCVGDSVGADPTFLMGWDLILNGVTHSWTGNIAAPDGGYDGSLGSMACVPITINVPGYRFRGHAYNGPVGDMTESLAGVNVTLYGRNAGEPEPGSYMKTATTDITGFFNFFYDDPLNFETVTLMVETPAGMVPMGVISENGTVVDDTTVQWDNPSKVVHENAFFFETPNAPDTGTTYLPLLSDTHTKAFAPDTNFVRHQALIVHTTFGDQVLLKFDRSQMPVNAVVVEARLKLFARSQSGAADKTVAAMNVVPFTPGTVTFNTAPATSNPTAGQALVVPGEIVIDVTEQVNAWDNPFTSYRRGYLALNVTGSAGRVAFDSIEAPVGQEAMLHVVYTTP